MLVITDDDANDDNGAEVGGKRKGKGKGGGKKTNYYVSVVKHLLFGILFFW